MSILLIALVVAILAIAMAIPPPLRIEVIGRDQGLNLVKLDGVRHRITDEELQHIRDTGQRLPDKSDPVTPTNAIDKIAELEARLCVLEKWRADTESLIAEAAAPLIPATPEAETPSTPLTPGTETPDTPKPQTPPETPPQTPATTPPPQTPPQKPNPAKGGNPGKRKRR